MALKQVSFLFPLARASALRQVSLRTATPCSRLYSDSSKSTWSKSQANRQESMKGARFTGIDLSAQPLPPPAIDFISEVKVIEIEGSVAHCDGGHYAMGHPRIYINVTGDEPVACLYCGQRFAQKHEH